MQFAVHDQVIDERARKATIRWVCQHDFATVPSLFQRWLLRAMYGRSPTAAACHPGSM
jgi:hypothetical protein